MTEILNLGNRVVNNWLLRLNGKTVLVDTGYPDGFAGFQKRLEQQGLKLDDIDYLFLTHAHDDHAGFVSDVLAASHARLILHAKALPTLRRGQNDFGGGCTGRLAYLTCLLMKAAGKAEHRFPPLEDKYDDRLLTLTPENRAKLESELGVLILDTPGHTACSVSLLTGEGLLFCGDAAMNGFPSIGRVTIWAEDLSTFRTSWEAIIVLNPRFLYPGHGKPFPVADLQKHLDAVEKHKIYKLS